MRAIFIGRSGDGTHLSPVRSRARTPRHRLLILGVPALSAALWVHACGDRTTEPPPTPPDPPRATSLTVTPATAQLTALGATVQLTAEVRDQSGNVMTGAAVTWSSSEAAVATVNGSGLVTAVANGTATITATAGAVSGTAMVTVAQGVNSVTVTPAANTLFAGDTLRLVAEATDANGHGVDGARFTWSSSNVSVATVDDTGLVQGVAEGAATIMAAAGEASGTSEVTVGNPDRAALVALYHATDGPNWVNNDNWLTDAPLREWYGVETDAFGRVLGIDLSGREPQNGENEPHGLTGTIPPELGKLANLTHLNLSINTLIGPIPPELGNLANLQSLALAYNGLAGSIPPELGNLANLASLNLQVNRLRGSIPPELGNLANLTSLDLLVNELSGSIPPELGNLANLISLNLLLNELTGSIPPELGNLANLTSLNLRNNNFSGPIPHSLMQLARLDNLNVGRNELLCVPGSAEFMAWLGTIRSYSATSVSMCNAGDLAALTSLYEATGGTGWTRSAGWLGDGAVEEWHGVTTDSIGRVTGLDLTRNGLVGQLPASLGSVTGMTLLRIVGNSLSGRLPLSLVRLPLRELHYAETELCVPPDRSFQAWLNSIASHEGTGLDCEALSDGEVLKALFDVTGGPNWHNNQNWLGNAPIGDWYGAEVDGEGRVIGLSLHGNNLKGFVPPELGNLARLQSLDLASNSLAGVIPSELGNLARLGWLTLDDNALTGPIPPELGNLANLRSLDLASNSLTGAIPPELGNLARLQSFWLRGNNLSGPIPAELGNLVRLSWLALNDNNLTGPIPPELGNLSALRALWLQDNDLSGVIPPELGNLANLRDLQVLSNLLTGPVPVEFGGIAGLQRLGLSYNPGMAGVLPTELTALIQLDELLASRTGLCAPADADFVAWLEGIHKHRIAMCREGYPPAAYLTQAIQSREFPVPLVAGERALLRVFVTAPQATDEGIPHVTARFFRNGRQIHVVDIPGKSTPLPTEVDEGSLEESANAQIPGHVVQPDVEMVVEVDPNGEVDPALGVANRIPETGRMAMGVRTMPLFDLTLVPFIWTETNDSSIVDLTRAMAADPENHDMLEATRTLLPVGDLEVTAHEPVLSSSNNAYKLLSATEAIRAMEGEAGHYMGMMSPVVFGVPGTAYLPGRTSFSVPDPFTMAHELGHNLSLSHAPCGGAGGPDPSFPYPDGSIGSWGYDFRDGGGLVHPSHGDLLSYCGPNWISDYHFTNALAFRLSDSGGANAAPSATAPATTQSLLLWGGVTVDTVPFLEPVFVVEAAPTLPRADGDYQLTGNTDGGGQLFSLAFDMPEVADGDGSSSFAFVLPVRSGWEANLVRITLTGPAGSVTLDADSDLPMAILRNPRTGQVRGILRDLPPGILTRAAADATVPQTPGLQVLFSRGIPTTEAWRRSLR